MPEFHLTDSILTSLNAQEPWPDNVKLFQPYEVEQILLPDNASCLAVQAFLKMCNLPFEVEMRWNAEFMSPSGRVPFIKCGAFVVSELEPIVQFAANKSVTLCGKLSTEEKAEMRAYMSLITNVLVNAELYISWIDNDTYNAVTKVRNSSVYPWPLGWLQTRSKRNAVAKRLKALHWHDKTLEQVLADVEQCCNSLSQRLGDRDYFFGTTPTPLDALVYGHMRAILSAQGPKAALMIKTITSPLLRHIVRVVNLTKMQLTAQEEYLLTQAFEVTRRRNSPERTRSERSARMKKSKLCVNNASKDSIAYNKDVFGFKPFASKQIIIMNSKGGLNCKYEHPYKHIAITLTNEENYQFALDIIDDILDKVDEIAFEELNDRLENDDKNDFEIVYPHVNESKYDNVMMKMSEYLDTIDEVGNSPTVTFEKVDIVHVINDHNVINDCDELINDMINNDELINDMIHSGGLINDHHTFEGDVMINDDHNMIDSDGLINDKMLAFDNEKKICDNVSPASEFRPTELDALVFGHVFTIITTRLPCRRLAETVRKHETLVALAKRVDEQYFKRT